MTDFQAQAETRLAEETAYVARCNELIAEVEFLPLDAELTAEQDEAVSWAQMLQERSDEYCDDADGF
jgi:hypothetical protein